MSELFERFEMLQANIDALQPGPSRDALQSDLDLVAAIIDAMPGRIAEAASWDDAREAGAQRARIKFIERVCKAWAPPKPY